MKLINNDHCISKMLCFFSDCSILIAIAVLLLCPRLLFIKDNPSVMQVNDLTSIIDSVIRAFLL